MIPIERVHEQTTEGGHDIGSLGLTFDFPLICGVDLVKFTFTTRNIYISGHSAFTEDRLQLQ